MTPCLLCGSETAERGEGSEVCLSFSECDTRRCAMKEPTKAPEPSPPDPHLLRKMQLSSTYGRLTRPPRTIQTMAAVAMVLGASMGDMPGAPRRPRLEPPPPPPEDPPHPCEGKAHSGPHGRAGKAPIPRTFYRTHPMLPADGELESLLAQVEKRASDERHLTAAEAKRARKAQKRRGG